MFWVEPNLGEPCFAVGIGSGARPLGMSQTGNYSRNENWCETVDTPLSPLHPASIPLPLSLVHPPTMMCSHRPRA